MSSERDDGDEETGGGTESRPRGEGGGTHGGVAIGRTTGMGAGVATGGTPGPDEDAEGDASG